MRGWVSLVAALALGGCMTGGKMAPPADWWRGLGDDQLSRLIEHRLAPDDGNGVSLTAQIAQRYIELRARQTVLVLLARREELDGQMAMPAPHPVAIAQARLHHTLADQARVRAEIATLRDGLAVLVGAAPGALDTMPGGSIPLPPMSATRANGSRRYRAARIAEDRAQSRAAHTRIIAARQSLLARAGTLAADDAIAADLHALDALQAEQQARAAMTQAYVASVLAHGR